MPLVSKTFSEIITFTRASTGTYFNAAGTLTSAAINEPRLDYNPSTLAAQGLLLEEARTNSIRNNTMVGAVAGTPGTSPTNWFAVPAAGVTSSIVGTGTENGITYLDIRLNGTPSATASCTIGFEASNSVAALTGQTWTNSAYAKLAAGSAANVTGVSLGIIEYTSGGVFVAGAFYPITTPTSAGLNTQRQAATRTLSGGATVAAVQPVMGVGVTNGLAVDITLRIGLPQLELGAFATSVIPTSTIALTRAADVASVNTLSPWYNASEGTLYVQAQDMSDAAHATSQPRAVSINNGSNSAIDISRVPASAQARARIEDAGVTQFNSLTTAWPLATQAKVALAYKADDFAACLGGGAVATDALGSIPTVTTLTIGNFITAGVNGWTGWIQRITYYPRRLSDAELQTLTT